jgi:hypothetical protein
LNVPSLEEQSDDIANARLVNPPPMAVRGYWNGKFVLINVTILLLALVAGYLQYAVYPGVLSAPVPAGGYGESNPVLILSFLTFQINATGNCLGGTCVLRGVPAFDFCQAMIFLLIIVNIVHAINRRRF